MARVTLVGALVLAAVSALADTGAAQTPGEHVTVVDPIDIPPEHDPLAHAWDLPDQRGGFYLRGSASLGGQSTGLGAPSFESNDNGYTVGGFSNGFGLDVGGFLLPWLALHVDASFGALWSGNLDNDYYYYDEDYGPDARVLSYGVAPAVTFFTPHRFFLKPAFGVGWATVMMPGNDWTTGPGFYMHLVAGKDLYTDRHFGFGIQMEMAYFALNGDESNEDVRVRQFQFGVSFAYDSL